MALSPTSSRSSGGATTLTLLSTTTLGAPGTIDVTGISSAYTDLLLVLIARGTRAAAADGLLMQLNGDAGANYDYNVMEIIASSLSASPGNAQTSFFVGDGLPANSGVANSFSVTEITIAGYTSTTWLKTVNARYGADNTAATNKAVGISSGFWNSTAAVTRVTLFGQITANLATGSTLRIYGRT